MADINNIVISGRLTKDAVTKDLNTGTKVTEFSIANNTGWGQYAKTQFFDCKSFTKQASSVASYLVKGKNVAVSGSYETDKWTYNGAEHTRNVINVKDIILLSDGNKPESKDDVREPVVEEVTF